MTVLQLGYPPPGPKELTEDVLEWLCGHAVGLEYGDMAEILRTQAVHEKTSSADKNSSDVGDGLSLSSTLESAEFTAAVAELAAAGAGAGGPWHGDGRCLRHAATPGVPGA